MLTLLMLWENMQDSPLQSSSESSLAMQTIRSGLGLRSEDHKSFWDDFLRLCQSSDGLAELLEVRPDQISAWVSKISEMVEQVKKQDDNQDTKKVLPTGDFPSGNRNPF